MTTADTLVRGREAFQRRAWTEAHQALSAAREVGEALSPDDLERLALAALLTGNDDESDDALTAAHQECLRRGDVQCAARHAFWLTMSLMDRGEMARAGGWLGRARRLLEDVQEECAEHGYVLIPVALQHLAQGDAEGARSLVARALEIGERSGDVDLVTLGRLGLGQTLVALGETAEGFALFDEAMVAVTAGEVMPMVAGVVYCTVIESCYEAYDVGRAKEWTAALVRWCEEQPDLVPFRGECQVYRAELLRLQGDWGEALEEAERARARLLRPPPRPAAGNAYYQQAELHRLRGEYEQAAEAYRQASAVGRPVEPGFALLRLAQGQVDAAATALRRALDEATILSARPRLLAGYVEVMLAAGDVAAARTAADELTRIAGEQRAPLLDAMAAQAEGAVLLAEGDLRAALGALRRAWNAWQALDAPYESARVRVLIGLACRSIGDHDAAEMELDAARAVFRRLGAAPDLARLDASREATRSNAGSDGLTAREVEVLRLVAAGKSNRAIASELVISEKTVARHVSNILAKLGLPSRAAATAYAYEHGLVEA